MKRLSEEPPEEARRRVAKKLIGKEVSVLALGHYRPEEDPLVDTWLPIPQLGIGLLTRRNADEQ